MYPHQFGRLIGGLVGLAALGAAALLAPIAGPVDHAAAHLPAPR